MHASIPTIYFLFLVFFPVLISFLSSLSVYSFVFYSIISFLSSIPFHCSWLLLFIPSVIVGFTLFVPQPLLAPHGYPSRTIH